MSRFLERALAGGLLLALLGGDALAGDSIHGIGREATPEEIAG